MRILNLILNPACLSTNRIGLISLIGLYGLGGLYGLALSLPAFAHQRARIISRTAEVHESPLGDSPVLGEINLGQSVEISSKWITDVEGKNWHKVLLPNHEYGYIQANSIETQEVRRELASHRLAPYEGQLDAISHPYTWKFVLRTMGILIPPTTGSPNTLFGGEGELTYSIPLDSEGTLAHLIAIGPLLYQINGGNTSFGITLLIRPPLLTYIKPEIRFRISNFTGNSNQNYSVIGGAQIPLTRYYGTHLAGYAELGSFFDQRFYTYLPFASLGLGLHF